MINFESFIKQNEITYSCEAKIVSYIERHIKINPLGTIDWYKLSDVILMEKISENVFPQKLKEMLRDLNSSASNFYFIIQVDGALPPLRARIDCWLAYFKDVFYPDTIFLSVDGCRIAHYDFYGNLWGKIIFSESEIIENNFFA